MIPRDGIAAAASPHRLTYVFDARNPITGVVTKLNSESIVSTDEIAAFADPDKRLVLYDPTHHKSAVPVTSKAALARKRDVSRQAAVWLFPILTAIIMGLAAFGLHTLKRRLCLLRFGVATTPTMVEYTRDRLGRSRVEYRFSDADG